MHALIPCIYRTGVIFPRLAAHTQRYDSQDILCTLAAMHFLSSSTPDDGEWNKARMSNATLMYDALRRIYSRRRLCV